MQLHKDYFCRSYKDGGNQHGFGTHGGKAEELFKNKEFGVIFMKNFKLLELQNGLTITHFL